MAMKSSRKLRGDSDSTATIQNKVHQLIEYIENNLGGEGRIKKSFATAALTGTLRFLDEISKMEGVSAQKKVDVLTQIYQAANSKIEELNASAAMTPGVRWAERKQRFMSPCDFVRANYPMYGRGLNLAQVRKADRQLYQALMRLKSEHGWPSTFNLPSKSAQIDTILENADTVDVEQRDDLPPAERRRRRQIANARHYRARKA
jgi:hypothetical protein